MAVTASPGMPMRSRTGTRYRFDPGALCLELLTTGGPGKLRVFEVLHSPDDLAAWVERCRLTPTPSVTITQDEVQAVRELRDTLFRLTMAHVDGAKPRSTDLDRLNTTAAEAALAPAIGADGRRTWAAPADGTRLAATLARDAVELLTGKLAHRIRTCAAADCQLIYVDTSRPGTRRWCSMEHCGNLHKVRGSRARRSGGTSSITPGASS